MDESDQERPSHRTRVTLRYTSEAREESWVLPAQGEANSVRVPQLSADLADRAPYGDGQAEPSPGARSRLVPPSDPRVWITSTTFSLSSAEVR